MCDSDLNLMKRVVNRTSIKFTEVSNWSVDTKQNWSTERYSIFKENNDKNHNKYGEDCTQQLEHMQVPNWTEPGSREDYASPASTQYP